MALLAVGGVEGEGVGLALGAVIHVCAEEAVGEDGAGGADVDGLYCFEEEAGVAGEAGLFGEAGAAVGQAVVAVAFGVDEVVVGALQAGAGVVALGAEWVDGIAGRACSFGRVVVPVGADAALGGIVAGVAVGHEEVAGPAHAVAGEVVLHTSVALICPIAEEAVVESVCALDALIVLKEVDVLNAGETLGFVLAGDAALDAGHAAEAAVVVQVVGVGEAGGADVLY